MTIRYKCDTCGSTLNIKEALAGTQGKCPKCKTAFTVPQPEAAAPAKSSPPPTAKPASAKAANAAKSRKRKSQDDDFDPMAVLMGGESAKGGASAKQSGRSAPAPPPLSDDEIPADDADFDLEIGEDDEEDAPRVKKPKKRKRVQFDSDDNFDASLPNSASATADAMLTGNASSGAKDLLTRTMEESRARASRVDDGSSAHDGPKVMDYVKEFGPKGAAIAGGLVVLVIGLYYFAGSMYGGGMPLPELGSVYGVVTLDGQPLEGARIRFSPSDRTQTIEGKERHRLRASNATTDANGYYELSYAEDVEGAAITEHRVVIMKMGSDGRLATPSAFADYSTETRTVEPGSNEFNFDLQSDPKPEPAGRNR